MSSTREALRRLVTSTLMPGFVGTSVPAWINEAYAAGLGSVCLYGANVAGRQELSSLCRSLRAGRPDLVLAVDEEGGDVTRLHYRTGSPEPGNALLGRLDDTRLTRESAARVGAELAAYGINLDLGPVADVNSADDNPVIGVRSFGAEAALVARHSAAFVTGLQDAGVAACAKHFPGHGDTVADSHLELPRVDATASVLDERELEPFRAAVAAGVASVMTSHVVVSAVDAEQPATFSEKVLVGVLRDQLGFQGVIVSDALDMAGASRDIGIPAAAVRALAAGCDLLCLGSETTEEGLSAVVDALVAAVEGGQLDVARVEDAAARVARLAAAFPVAPTHSSEHSIHRTGVPTGDVLWTERSLEWRRGFEVGERAREWLALAAPPAIVQIGSGTNLAVGHVAWGPAAAGVTIAAEEVPAGAKVAVVGRGLDAEHRAWDVAERLRAGGHATIVVECGWPRGGADVVTFGGSLGVGRALADLLGVHVGDPAPSKGRDR